MSDVTPNRPLQVAGAGDALAIALKEYGGLVISAFDRATTFWNRTYRKTITSGKSHQFPATWRSTETGHNPGTELAGTTKPQSVERIINVETKERVAHNYLSELDDFISHFDVRSEYAKQHAEAIAVQADKWIAQVVALGARKAAEGDFDAGNRVQRGGATVAAAYPVSTTGSTNLQSDLAAMAQAMDEKYVPKEGRVAFLSPYLLRVLRQDNTITSKDWTDPNNKITRRVLMVEGFEIEETNHLPTTDLSADANTPTDYRGKFVTTAALCMAGPMAVGTVIFGGILPFGPTWIEDKLSYLIGARVLKGHGILRPEACGELHISGV